MEILASHGVRSLNKVIIISFQDSTEEKRVGEEVQNFLENAHLRNGNHLDDIMSRLLEIIDK